MGLREYCNIIVEDKNCNYFHAPTFVSSSCSSNYDLVRDQKETIQFLPILSSGKKPPKEELIENRHKIGVIKEEKHVTTTVALQIGLPNTQDAYVGSRVRIQERAGVPTRDTANSNAETAMLLLRGREATSTIHKSEWKHVAPTVADDDGNDASSELKDIVQGLPSNVVKELLSLGVSMDDSVDAANDSTVSCDECSDSTIGESDLVGEKPFNSLLKSESSECCKFLLEKVGAIVP
ncbi:zinc finger protein WIP3-like [Senna tora]|uniref:Zinc finger protein WIP3-like n=1 Tax=Senna tora TaxID=362788 RepID=A0A834TK28_9FABA|nr:zinc finger protein WIP3-like [Senna tora]